MLRKSKLGLDMLQSVYILGPNGSWSYVSCIHCGNDFIHFSGIFIYVCLFPGKVNMLHGLLSMVTR